MTVLGWVQIIVFCLLLLATVRPLGGYMTAVFAGERTLLSPLLGPVERGTYRLAGIDPRREQDWLAYALAMLAFSLIGALLLYALLRLQAYLPLNPRDFAGMGPELATNTAISFVTNTNWQNYGGEATLGHLAQMLGLTVQNFVSAATGMALAVALIRGFARNGSTAGGGKGIGNFWADLVRAVLYVLLPASLVAALAFVAMGVPQTLEGAVTATTLSGGSQTIAVGPVASQLAIKMLGTNGGGFFNVNSAHPFENPTALANLLQMVLIFAIGAALTNSFGRMVGDERQGWAILAAMGVMFLVAVLVAYAAEAGGNPLLGAQVDSAAGNMEGKETRFGTALSVLFAVITTAASCGAVNAMHDSFTPLGGLVPMVNMMLGEVIVGGVGAGLYGMLLFVVLAVFVAGLMVGRTPEYLGKKIEAREVKLTMLAVLCVPFAILLLLGLASVVDLGRGAIQDAGPHGFSEMLYAYTSAAANNGSAFGGLSGNSPYWNLTLALAMLVGRFAIIVPVLAIAGSLVGKPRAAPTSGTFPTTGPLFVGLLIGVIVILGGLTYLPALALGPIVEHLALSQGQTF